MGAEQSRQRAKMSKHDFSCGDVLGFYKALESIAETFNNHENPHGASVGRVGECEYVFSVTINGKKVNVIEMLTKHLWEQQTTYCTISADRDHVDIFWAMVEAVNPYEVTNFLLTSGYCKRYALFKEAARVESLGMGKAH
jgi:hypothetical protein